MAGRGGMGPKQGNKSPARDFAKVFSAHEKASICVVPMANDSPGSISMTSARFPVSFTALLAFFWLLILGVMFTWRLFWGWVDGCFCLGNIEFEPL
jgi:hypothetical protein